jgi:hypothetical protein
VCKGAADRAIQDFQLPTMAEQGEPFFDDGRSARFVTVFGSDSYAVIAHSDDEQYDEAQKVIHCGKDSVGGMPPIIDQAAHMQLLTPKTLPVGLKMQG